MISNAFIKRFTVTTYLKQENFTFIYLGHSCLAKTWQSGGIFMKLR